MRGVSGVFGVIGWVSEYVVTGVCGDGGFFFRFCPDFEDGSVFQSSVCFSMQPCKRLYQITYPPIDSLLMNYQSFMLCF